MDAVVRIVRVFDSSPSDVGEERKHVDEVVRRINNTQGKENSVRIELTRWETDVVPQVGPEPQEVVDRQTPEYDVYLGIMAARFGTPTGGHGSGTEKELRDAVERWGKAGRPRILFYFRNKPPLSSEPEDVEQFLEVCKFRKELESMGIVGSYTAPRGDKTAFFEQVELHLRGILSEIAPPKPAAPDRNKRAASLTAPAISQAYREWLLTQGNELELLGLKLKQGQAVRLNHVYVPLTTPAGERQAAADSDATRRLVEDQERKPTLLLDLLNERSLYVSGAPGSGKSTFCRWVAVLACSTAMPDQRVAAPDGYAETFPDALAGRLPLLVRLREFWPYLPETPDCRQLSREQLEEALARWLDSVRPGGLEWAGVRAHLDRGSALLLIDGADEVPLSHGDEKHPSCPRAMLLAGLTEAIPSWIDRGNRVLLTSRPYGLDDRDARKLPLFSAPIDDLAPEARLLLMRKWFHVLKDDPGLAAATATQMREHLAEREDLEPLTANPMLLTAMCIIYGEGKRLPQDKADLYDRIVDNVLHNRYDDPGTIDAVRNRLCVVAHGMHTGKGLGEDRATPEAESTYTEIDRMLQSYREQSSYTEPGFVGAVQAREDLLAGTGILLPRGDKRAGFYHLSFQEFLAAERLVDLAEGQLDDLFLQRAGTPEWRNTLSFVFGSRLARSVSPQNSIRLAERLIDRAGPPQALGLQVAVADCLEILLGRKLRLSEEFEEKFRRICLEVIAREAPVRERRHLGLVLGRLGDPRLPTDPRDRSGYVEIPAGSYPFGDEGRRHRLERFWIGKYSVTNAWFGAFLEAGGYEDRGWWSEPGWKWRENEGAREPVLWHHGKWNAPSLPVVGVSFWEAEAFCTWVGGRLPTEQEWEAAGCGPESYDYPWGNDWEDGICNTREAGVGATTPVGIFPRSRSRAFGLEDMAGNVWEWTRTDHDTGEPADPRSESWRVLRGGSWNGIRASARAAYRNYYLPDFRSGFVGFRVVCSLPHLPGPLTAGRRVAAIPFALRYGADNEEGRLSGRPSTWRRRPQVSP